MNDMMAMVLAFDGQKKGIKHIPGPEGVRGRNSDNKLILEKLGWAPSIRLADGMRINYDWIKVRPTSLLPLLCHFSCRPCLSSVPSPVCLAPHVSSACIRSRPQAPLTLEPAVLGSWSWPPAADPLAPSPRAGRARGRGCQGGRQRRPVGLLAVDGVRYHRTQGARHAAQRRRH